MIKLNEIQAKYGEYLVDEDKLKELLVKPKPKTVWDLKDGNGYSYINTISNIYYDTWNGDAWDLRVRENGNVFLTKEEAEFEVERRKCEAIMLKYGRRTFKYNKDNYLLRINNNDEKVEVGLLSIYQFQGSIYFDTEELAQTAMNEIGEERLKKYIFRVEK